MTRLFHISDLHFGAEDRAALNWFETIVRAEQPDAIVVTGDLTLQARPREFAAAAEWLAALGRPMTIEAGNHDLPYFNLFERLFRPYRRFGGIEQSLERPLDLSGVSIVPLKTTARFQWRLNWSKGHVSAASLRDTLGKVRSLPPDGLVFISCHHPLAEPGTRTTAETRGGERALNALAAAGAVAVLTGHVHDAFELTHEANGRPIRLIGAGTLSERIRTTRPSFNEIRIAGRDFSTYQRLMDPATSQPMWNQMHPQPSNSL